MELWLVDENLDLVNAWKDEFAAFPDVRIRHGNILSMAENTIVSAANSYGFMDGGLDRLYTEFFGYQPQEEIQKQIALRAEGYLPVGAAVIVHTGHQKIPYMIAAPTMMSPGAVRPANCFFAMSAVLLTAHANSRIVTKVFCPGLCTGIGQVAPAAAAKEMAAAWRKFLRRINEK